MGFFITMQYVIITKCIIIEISKKENMMKFYDRKTELEKLDKFATLADRNFFFIRITGRRRIGKTLLIRQYLKGADCQSLYFFVTKKKQKLLLDEYSTIISVQFEEYSGISFKDFDDFFRFIFSS
jgi:AAA+ ATPase superfamily predicted ATPase